LRKRQERVKEVKLIHGTLLDLVAGIMDVDYQEILDGVVDKDEHITYLNNLVDSGNVAALFFVRDLLPPPPIGEYTYLTY